MTEAELDNVGNDRSSEVSLVIRLRVTNSKLDETSRRALHQLAYKAAARMFVQSQLIGGTEVTFQRVSQRQGTSNFRVDMEHAKP